MDSISLIGDVVGGFAGAATYQPVSAAQAQSGYAIPRDGPEIVVKLTEDLTAAATWTLPTVTVATTIWMVREGAGSFDWAATNAGTALKLGYRGDIVRLQWRTGTTWSIERFPSRNRKRRESVGRDIDFDDQGAVIYTTASDTWNIPQAMWESQGFQVEVRQRGASAATITFGGTPTIVGSTDTVTDGDGTGLRIEYAGAGEVQVTKTVYDPSTSSGGSARTEVEDATDYSSTPYTVVDATDAHLYFTGAQDHIIEFPEDLSASPASYGTFTAPSASTLTIRRVAGAAVSINGVASDAFTWVVPAGGSVDWEVRADNTIHLRGDISGAVLDLAGNVLGGYLIASDTESGARDVSNADSGKTLIYTGAGHGWTFDAANLDASLGNPHGVIRNAGSGVITCTTDGTEKFSGTEPIPVDASATWEWDGTRLWLSVNA